MAADDPRPVVAHLVHHYAAPTESFIVNQIESISGYRVVVGCHHRFRDSLYPLVNGIAATDVLGPLASRLDRLAYAAHALPTPFAASAIARALKSADPVLAHVHYLSDACYFRGTLRKLGVPFVISGYGADVSWFPHSLHGLAGILVRRAFRDATAVIAMSDDMRCDFIRLGCEPEKIITHYYGSDCARFARSQPLQARAGEIHLLSSCGRLAEKKGLEFTLDALALLRDRGVTGWRLTVLGDGPRRPGIEARISRLDLGEHVHLAGHIPYTSDELQALFHGADVLVQPSLSTDAGDKEGIPGVIVEGMASGLAVVASRHAGIPAVIEDGISGLLVPERDPAAVAAAIERLIRDGTLRRRLGAAAARRAANELDLRTRTPVLESIYDHVAGIDRAGRERGVARLEPVSTR